MGAINHMNNRQAVNQSSQASQASQQTLAEVQMLRREVAELKQLILNLK